MFRRRTMLLGALLALLPTAALADPAVSDPNGLTASEQGFMTGFGAALAALVDFFMGLF